MKDIEISLELKEALPRALPCNPRPVPNKLRAKFEEYLDNMTKYFLGRSDILIATLILRRSYVAICVLFIFIG